MVLFSSVATVAPAKADFGSSLLIVHCLDVLTIYFVIFSSTFQVTFWGTFGSTVLAVGATHAPS
jgi:hypothetical protein